jgi:serine/threonine-protein kinase
VPFAPRGHELIRTLAVGAMAVSFEVTSARDGARLVCKRLLPRFEADDEAGRMLLCDADVLRKLAGRGAPLLVDAGTDEHGPYVVLERVDAPSLGSWLQGERQVPGAGSLERTARAAFLALAAVHEATDDAGPLAIVHADLSPDNVLADEGRAWIIDYALASWRDAPRAAGGPFRGTLLYAAPEAARGEAVDQRCDLFALAASLLHVASGLPPRTATRPAQLLVQAGEIPIAEYAEQAGATLDRATARGLARCVAFDRRDRPGAAREVFGAAPG